jgi:tRNA/rRNA methyltransferase
MRLTPRILRTENEQDQRGIVVRNLNRPEGEAPILVLVRPQMGENIGASARAMLNFGLEHMRLVAPRDGWPNPAAVAMASGASKVLDHARVFPDVPAALADCTRVYATTARGRELTRPVLTPEAAMADARARIAAGERVAVLFGPERAGLENDDIVPAQVIVTVPVNPEFYSLNLAQCVLLMAYEWGRQTLPPFSAPAGPDPATGDDVARLAQHFDERLGETGFFFPPEKAPVMRQTLRAMLYRWGLTRPEVQTLHGVLRHLARKGGGGVEGGGGGV